MIEPAPMPIQVLADALRLLGPIAVGVGDDLHQVAARIRAKAASNSASLTRKAKCCGRKSSRLSKSRVTPLAVLTGTKWPHSGPASRFRISARNLAEVHLSLAGMIV